MARDEVSFIYGGRSIRRAVDENEDIKLEASMSDGYVTVPKLGDVAFGEDLRLHISVIVDISRGDGGEKLEFLCSAWPDHLEIQKVYLLGHEKMLGRPFMGPDFRELQKTLREYLEARGVNDELSFFLHEYMLNKHRIELIQWFGKVKSFVEKQRVVLHGALYETVLIYFQGTVPLQPLKCPQEGHN